MWQELLQYIRYLAVSHQMKDSYKININSFLEKIYLWCDLEQKILKTKTMPVSDIIINKKKLQLTAPTTINVRILIEQKNKVSK